MASELEVLRTLRELRAESREDKASRRSHSLAVMQMKALQEQTEFQQVGARLQMLSQVNEQLMQSHAEEFISNTGIGAVYASYIDEKEGGLEEVVEQLQSQYKLSQNQSNRVASALYGYYEAKNTSGIMGIASDLASSVRKAYDEEPLSSSDKKFVQALYTGTPLGVDPEKGLKSLSSIQKVMQNRGDILAEIMEYGAEGDIGIERPIGMFESEEGEVALEDLATTEKPGIPGIIPTPEEDMEAAISSIETMESDIKQKRESLNSLDLNLRYLSAKSRKGLKLSDKEEQWMVRAPEMESLFKSEIDSLNKLISEQQDIQETVVQVEQERVAANLFQPLR
tara:strand:+ start:5 stop:1021 length:1017 start_codon:yes stop_codon:yes gene_type:complete